jgi:hypothetical protein
MIHAFCNVGALVNNAVLHLRELAEKPEEQFMNQYVIAYLYTCSYSLQLIESSESSTFWLKWYLELRAVWLRVPMRTWHILLNWWVLYVFGFHMLRRTLDQLARFRKGLWVPDRMI